MIRLKVIALCIICLFVEMGCGEDQSVDSKQSAEIESQPTSQKITYPDWVKEVIGGNRPPSLFRTLKLGDPLSKVKNLPGTKRSEEMEDGWYLEMAKPTEIEIIKAAIGVGNDSQTINQISVSIIDSSREKLKSFTDFLLNQFKHYYGNGAEVGSSGYVYSPEIEGEKLKVSLSWELDLPAPSMQFVSIMYEYWQ